MLRRIDDRQVARRWAHVAVLLALAVTANGASAQNQPASPAPNVAPPASQDTTPPAEAAPRRENPGLINEIGKLLEKSPSLLPSFKLPNLSPNPNPVTEPAAPDPVTATPNPVAPPPASQATPPALPDSGSGLGLALPRSLMATGRMVCPVAANGAPDCKVASDKLCQTKGFREGKSLDTDAAESCSPKVFIPGRKREPGDCRMDSFVTRAICQ